MGGSCAQFTAIEDGKSRIPIITFRVSQFTENNIVNNKNYNFLACDWFKKVLFSTNSLAKLLSDSLLLFLCLR